MAASFQKALRKLPVILLICGVGLWLMGCSAQAVEFVQLASDTSPDLVPVILGLVALALSLVLFRPFMSTRKRS